MTRPCAPLLGCLILSAALSSVAGGVPLPVPAEEPGGVDALLELGAPERVEPGLVEALALLNGGRLDESIAEVRRLLETSPRSAAAYEILGAALAKKGEIPEAQEALETAVRLEPYGITGLRKLGNVQLARGRTDEAQATFQRVLELDATDRIAHQRLGMIAQRAGRYREAMEHYQQGIIGAPGDYVGVKIDLARLYNSLGRYDDTLRLLRPVAEQAASNAALASVLGTAYLESGEVWSAMTHLRQLVQLRPDEAAAAYLLAVAQRRAGDPTAALAQARRARELEPGWAPAHLLEGELLLDLGRPEEALAPLEKAASLTDDASLPRLRMAAARAMAGDRPGARAQLEALVAEGTPLPDAYTSLGTLQQEEADLDGARATFEAALARFPDDAAVLSAAGRFHGFVQEYEIAIPLLEKALEKQPDDRRALRSLAWACARAGRGKQARELADRLVRREPTLESRLLLANVLRETGARPEAARLYEQILDERPEQPVALANLSLIRAEQERWEEARRLALRAADLVPADSSLRRTLDPILERESGGE